MTIFGLRIYFYKIQQILNQDLFRVAACDESYAHFWRMRRERCNLLIKICPARNRRFNNPDAFLEMIE